MTTGIYRETLRTWQLATGVVVLGMIGSVFLARQGLQSARQVEREGFIQAASATTQALARRIDAYTEIALGLSSLFIVNPATDRHSFMLAVSHLDVEKRYPGIENIAFTRYVTADQKAQFEAQVRADRSVEPGGYPNFSIHPPGQRPEYFVADYLWPRADNRIHGLDISAQPANLASMRYSQRSGKTVASAPFDLIQETTQRTGFVIRVPVFRGEPNFDSAQHKAHFFLGSVAVTLHVMDLFQQLEREGHLQGLQLSVSDRGSTFDDKSANFNRSLFATPSYRVDNASSHSQELLVHGRKWQLDFQPDQTSIFASQRIEPLLIGLGGCLISLLMGALVFLLARGRFLALALAAASNEKLKESESRWRFAIEGSGDGLWDWNMQTGQVFYSPRYKTMLGFADDEIGDRLDGWTQRIHPDDAAGVRAAMQPYMDGKPGTVSAEFRMQRKDGSWQWTMGRCMLVERDGQGKPRRMICTCSDITARRAAESQIQDLAFSDRLTGLPNRRLLLDRLQQAITVSVRHERKGALLMVDLDNFKSVNDSNGHDKGDLLLQQVAKSLSACVRDGDTVARVGGDEFVVLLEGLSASETQAATQAEALSDKMLKALNQTYLLAGHAHHSTASIGITLIGGQLESVEEPLRRSELAMYQAKAAGRNTQRFFDPQMQAVVTARTALEAALREALVKGQFLLYYQAQVNERQRITGVEALVRWFDPKRGLVPPLEFIGLAEETGLILPLGEWVMEAACAQLALWAKQPALAHLTVAVNVSARQFHQDDFVDRVLAVLDYTGANPARLKLELTESLLVANVEAVIAKMNALKGRGVSFSLDDFGTGYSSLSYLKRLPLRQLKIDQSFVRDILTDPNDAAIARMVLALAESLGLEVMAEGVETEAQRSFLASLGCNDYQGYLFSRPLPLAEFEAFALRMQTVPGNDPGHQ